MRYLAVAAPGLDPASGPMIVYNRKDQLQHRFLELAGGRPPERVHYVPRWADVPEVVAGLAQPGDLVITMGAGDVTVLGPEILAELGRRAGNVQPRDEPAAGEEPR
jgi:hypothetical protein